MTEPIVTAPAGVAAPHRLVRASAGSGKTHRLATRYLEILFSGGRPESIVAATFTRAWFFRSRGRVHGEQNR